MTRRYSEIRKEMAAQQGDGPLLLPCRFCHEPTPWQVLSDHGARCLRCAEEHKRQPLRVKPLPAGLVLKPHDPLNAVNRLLARRAAGERLGHAQRAFLAVWDRKQGALPPSEVHRDVAQHHQARAVLDAVRDGMSLRVDDINAALRETGDIGSTP